MSACAKKKKEEEKRSAGNLLKFLVDHTFFLFFFLVAGYESEKKLKQQKQKTKWCLSRHIHNLIAHLSVRIHIRGCKHEAYLRHVETVWYVRDGHSSSSTRSFKINQLRRTLLTFLLFFFSSVTGRASERKLYIFQTLHVINQRRET